MRLVDLREGRDAPLYHFAGENKARQVFEHNMLVGTWQHDLRAYLGKTVWGTSLTRNPRLRIGGKAYVFVLDQTRIAQTNKIIPLDAEYAYMKGSHTKPHELNRKDPYWRASRHRERYAPDWAEEFVVGTLKPAAHYITQVWAGPGGPGYVTLEKNPVWLYKFLEKFDRDGVFAWTRAHSIPFLWNDGETPVRDIRYELRDDSEVADWLET